MGGSAEGSSFGFGLPLAVLAYIDPRRMGESIAVPIHFPPTTDLLTQKKGW